MKTRFLRFVAPSGLIMFAGAPSAAKASFPDYREVGRSPLWRQRAWR